MEHMEREFRLKDLRAAMPPHQMAGPQYPRLLCFPNTSCTTRLQAVEFCDSVPASGGWALSRELDDCITLQKCITFKRMWAQKDVSSSSCHVCYSFEPLLPCTLLPLVPTTRYRMAESISLCLYPGASQQSHYDIPCTACTLYLKNYNEGAALGKNLPFELGVSSYKGVPPCVLANPLDPRFCLLTGPEKDQERLTGQHADMHSFWEGFFWPFRICKISCSPNECGRHGRVSCVGHLWTTSNTKECASPTVTSKWPAVSALGVIHSPSTRKFIIVAYSRKAQMLPFCQSGLQVSTKWLFLACSSTVAHLPCGLFSEKVWLRIQAALAVVRVVFVFSQPEYVVFSSSCIVFFCIQFQLFVFDLMPFIVQLIFCPNWKITICTDLFFKHP